MTGVWPTLGSPCPTNRVLMTSKGWAATVAAQPAAAPQKKCKVGLHSVVASRGRTSHAWRVKNSKVTNWERVQRTSSQSHFFSRGKSSLREKVSGLCSPTCVTPYTTDNAWAGLCPFQKAFNPSSELMERTAWMRLWYFESWFLFMGSIWSWKIILDGRVSSLGHTTTNQIKRDLRSRSRCLNVSPST